MVRFTGALCAATCSPGKIRWICARFAGGDGGTDVTRIEEALERGVEMVRERMQVGNQ